MGYKGDDTEFSPGGVLDLDARTFYFCITDQISPAMWVKMVGTARSTPGPTTMPRAGTWTAAGRTHCTCRRTSPSRTSGRCTVYDPQTRSMLQTDQRFPRSAASRPGLQANADTSVDVYFGPEPPAGNEANWLQTVPGKGWFLVLRLYGPLEPWFDKTWRPGEIEPVED